MPLAINTLPILRGRPLGAVTNAAGQALTFNAAGQLVPYVSGTPQHDGISEAGGSGFNAVQYGNLLTSSNRLQGTLLGHYDVSDHLRLHGEIWASRDSATNLAGQTYYNSALLGAVGTPNGDLALSTSNPFLSAADAATIQHRLRPGVSTFYLSRANTDLETGAFRSATDLYRLVGGLDGDFAAGSHHFAWEANLNYGHITTTTTVHDLDTQNFFNAIGMVTATNRGGIPCVGANSPAQTISASCAPLDIFGLGNETQAAINYVTALAQTRQIDTQLDFVADVKGDFAHLPGGDAKFVAGYEHRRESQSFDPGAFYRGQLLANGSYAQYGQGLPISPVSGAYHTDEGFAEMNLPLLRRLNLQGAARFTRNSMTGGFWSYSGGASYAPVEGITMRGNITRAFRAPSVTELFAPLSSVNEAGYDPCSAAFVTGGPNPATRAANCAAAGITQPFTSVMNSTSVKGLGGGNTGLQNERAHSWTAGATIAPRAIPGMALTADYIHINIANEITEPGLTNLLDACYDAVNYPNNAYCGSFTRNSAGQVVGFTDAYTNVADELFRALQASLTYRLPLSRIGMAASAGAISVKLNYLHSFQHDQQTGAGLPSHLAGSPANPRDNLTGSLAWARQAFDWRWDVTYNGPTQVALNVAPGTYTPSSVPAYWMFDTSIGIRTSDHIAFRMVMNNVFNGGVAAPYAFSPSRQFEAIMGRAFRLSAQIRF